MSDEKQESDNTYSWLNIFNIIIFVALIAFAGNYFLNEYSSQDIADTDTDTLPIVEPVIPEVSNDIASSASETLIEEHQTEEVDIAFESTLDESDPIAIDSINSFSDQTAANALINSTDILRSTVVFLDNFSRGIFLANFSPFNAPKESFSAKESDNSLYMDSTSYQRYNPYIDYIESINAALLIQHYQKFKPMIDEAYAEVSRPDARFEEVIDKVAVLIMDTPVINEPIKLQAPSVMYTYDDPYLEELNDAQKFILRLGPHNLTKLKDKITQINIELNNNVE